MLPLAPGCTEESRATKFGNWNGTSGYYERTGFSLAPYKTDNMSSQVYNTDMMRTSSGICKSMRVANKSQVVKKKEYQADNIIRPVDFRRSVSQEQHVDFGKESAEANRRVISGEDFRDSFMKVANEIGKGQDDAFITMKHVSGVVSDCIGDGVPRFILDKFMVLCKRAEVGGKLYWADFVRLVPQAIEAATADCSLKKETAPLVLLMTKPRIVDPDLGKMYTHKTAYADTFCVTNSKLIEDRLKVEDGTPHSILNIASKDLALGSVKGTLQIPGYSGHMPMNLATDRKKDHSHGANLHPTINSLRMTKKGGNNVLGYAAHTPWHASSDRERLCGMDPRTSTGAAFGPTRLIL